MKKFPYIVTVMGYEPDNDFKKYEDTVLLYCESFSEAAEIIDAYFGDTAETCSIKCVGDEYSLFHIPKSVIKHFEEDDLGFRVD